MSERDHEYFTKRAEIEAERARRAAHPVVAAAHRRFASAYLERVAAAGPNAGG